MKTKRSISRHFVTSRLCLDHVSHYKAPPVAAVSPHTVERHMQLVEIVMGGTVWFRSGKTDLKLGCGALFWHIAGEKTIHRTEPTAPYECLALRFFESPGGCPEPRPPRLTVIADRHRTLELCAELLRSFHDPSVERQALSHYAEARLLWEVHLGRMRSSESPPASLEKACDLIEKHFGHVGLGVAEIARTAGISEPHLHFLFQKFLKKTPHQFLTDRRMREARLLLSGSAQAIKKISASCGFLNIETFYRVFSKHTGVTPNRFRRTHGHPMMFARAAD